MIRYQPKGLKSCFFTKLTRNLIAAMETKKATIMPVKRIISSDKVKLKPNLSSLTALAPNMAGIARKNENSAETNREAPKNIAPRIVEPDLEVPGIKEST